MTRKSISLVLVLLALSAILGGCTLFGGNKAADDYNSGLPPEDENKAAMQEAITNTISLPNTPSPEETQPAPTAETTQAATAAPTEAATVAPTPIVVTPQATAEATVTAPTTNTVTGAATVVPATSSTPGKHIVQANENLFRIALRYGTTVEALAQANGITNPALITVGRELNIPSGGGTTPTLPSTGGATGGAGGAYTVQAGDNLFRIALKYNFDQYYLARYNGISNPALIYPGQTIRIPSE